MHPRSFGREDWFKTNFGVAIAPVPCDLRVSGAWGCHSCRPTKFRNHRGKMASESSYWRIQRLLLIQKRGYRPTAKPAVETRRLVSAGFPVRWAELRSWRPSFGRGYPVAAERGRSSRFAIIRPAGPPIIGRELDMVCFSGELQGWINGALISKPVASRLAENSGLTVKNGVTKRRDF